MEIRERSDGGAASMILVTGATGHVGREVASQLLSMGVEVRTATRRPDSAGLVGPEVLVAGEVATGSR